VTGSRVTFLFGAVLAVTAIACGLFAGDQLVQLIASATADLSDLSFGNVGNGLDAAGGLRHGR
jgi:hypothetical protein